jgi:hypothetical protein
MGEGVEVFKRQISGVLNVLQCIHDGGPVCRAVEKWSKGFQGVIRPFFGEFLEMDVLDAMTEYRNPMFRELEHHDVAGIEVSANVIALEMIDEGVHFKGREQVSIEEDILDIHGDPEFFGLGQQFFDGFLGSPITHVVGNGIMVGTPRHMNGSRYDQKVANFQLVGGFGHLPRQIQPSFTFFGSVARQRVGPKQKGAETTDGDADLVGLLS